MRILEIEIRLGHIHDAVNEVYAHLPSTFEEFKELGIVKHGIYKQTEFALQCIIDVCAILHSDFNLGVPESEDQILDNLKNSKDIDAQAISLVQEMKRFRNVLVHRYGEIDDALAFKTLKEGAKDFKVVIQAFEKILKKEKEKQQKRGTMKKVSP